MGRAGPKFEHVSSRLGNQAVSPVALVAVFEARGRMIAVVDDDDGAREALVFLLQALGWKVVGMPNAAQFRACRHDAFCRLIFGLHMAGESGLHLAQDVRAARVTTPIMLICGGLTDGIMREGARSGIDVVAEKPVAAGVLARFLASGGRSRGDLPA